MERLIAQRKQHLQQLDDLLKSVFLEMFGDPVRNEKGWDTLPFNKAGKFKSGGTPSKNRDDFWCGDFPWVSPKDMKVSKICDSEDHISESVFEETTLKRIAPNHLLIVVRGMILAHSFPLAINTVEVAINQDMKAIKPINGLKVSYLQHCLNALKRQILKLISTAGHGTRRFDSVAMQKLLIPNPPPDLQSQFASMAEKVEGIKTQYQQSLTELENLYGALSQKAFKGELDLSRVPLPSQQEDQKKESEEDIESEQSLPEEVKATLANLNELNKSATHLNAIAGTTRSTKLDLRQLDPVKKIAELLAAFRTPLQELKQMDAIAQRMEKAQEALKPLNLEHMEALTKSVELARTITTNLPKIDLGWLEQHRDALRKATEPFETMRKAMAHITIPSIKITESMELASETAKRLQGEIPDFHTWQQQASDEGTPDLNDEQETIKRPFTSEDVTSIFAQATAPIAFDSLIAQLGELEIMDLAGYETIRGILFDLLAEQRLTQRFDEEKKTLLIMAAP